MKFLFLVFFPSIIFADIQTCVNDYNEAVVERNSALGSYKLAQSQKTAADGVIEAPERKRYIKEAKASAIAALDIFARSESLLDMVQKKCAQSIVDKANELSQKNRGDISDIELFKKDMELTLQLPK